MECDGIPAIRSNGSRADTQECRLQSNLRLSSSRCTLMVLIIHPMMVERGGSNEEKIFITDNHGVSYRSSCVRRVCCPPADARSGTGGSSGGGSPGANAGHECRSYTRTGTRTRSHPHTGAGACASRDACSYTGTSRGTCSGTGTGTGSSSGACSYPSTSAGASRRRSSCSSKTA